MDRMRRAGDLKVELLEFGLEPRFAAERDAVLADASDETAEDGAVASQLIDSFLLEHELAGGGTVLDRFLAAGAKIVFVGFATGLHGRHDVVVPYPSHENHMHVRFRAA